MRQHVRGFDNYLLTGSEGSVHTSQPSWIARMSSMSYFTHQRRLVPGSYAGKEAPDELSAPCSSRHEGCSVNDCTYTKCRASEGFLKDRKTRLQGDQGAGCRYTPRGYDGASPPAADQTWCDTQETIHERLGAEARASKQSLSVSYRKFLFYVALSWI